MYVYSFFNVGWTVRLSVGVSAEKSEYQWLQKSFKRDTKGIINSKWHYLVGLRSNNRLESYHPCFPR